MPTLQDYTLPVGIIFVSFYFVLSTLYFVPCTLYFVLNHICLTFTYQSCTLSARMENQPTNYDLSTLDTEAMRSRLSELGSYL